MLFQLKLYRLPHDGVVPGARGHKKIVVPAGTPVHCIVYGTKIYWCAYLEEAQALKCIAGLEATVNGPARHQLKLGTLLAWNFGHDIPRRICRPRGDQE